MSKEWSTFADGYDCKDCTYLEDQIKKLKTQVREYEKVLSFYADKNNYQNRSLGYHDILLDDIQKFRTTHNPDEYYITGGFRANKVLNKYKALRT